MLCFSLCNFGIAFLCNAQQPQAPLSSSPALIEHNLVNVGMVYPPLLQEIRYATMCNFTGQVIYPFPTAFVHRDVAAALEKVQEELKTEGLCLKIFDGYRPFSVQTKMWMLVPDARYVSDPNKSKGKHTRGTAVDVTLVDRIGKRTQDANRIRRFFRQSPSIFQ